jgi:hypothetical protein
MDNRWKTNLHEYIMYSVAVFSSSTSTHVHFISVELWTSKWMHDYCWWHDGNNKTVSNFNELEFPPIAHSIFLVVIECWKDLRFFISFCSTPFPLVQHPTFLIYVFGTQMKIQHRVFLKWNSYILRLWTSSPDIFDKENVNSTWIENSKHMTNQ